MIDFLEVTFRLKDSKPFKLVLTSKSSGMCPFMATIFCQKKHNKLLVGVIG